VPIERTIQCAGGFCAHDVRQIHVLVEIAESAVFLRFMTRAAVHPIKIGPCDRPNVGGNVFPGDATVFVGRRIAFELNFCRARQPLRSQDALDLAVLNYRVSKPNNPPTASDFVPPFLCHFSFDPYLILDNAKAPVAGFYSLLRCLKDLVRHFEERLEATTISLYRSTLGPI
jgi:hypothetical protein